MHFQNTMTKILIQFQFRAYFDIENFEYKNGSHSITLITLAMLTPNTNVVDFFFDFVWNKETEAFWRLDCILYVYIPCHTPLHW